MKKGLLSLLTGFLFFVGVFSTIYASAAAYNNCIDMTKFDPDVRSFLIGLSIAVFWIISAIAFAIQQFSVQNDVFKKI